LAKDAAGMGDRILEQSYLQHAEHYQRVINSWNEENASRVQETRQHTQDKADQADKPQSSNQAPKTPSKAPSNTPAKKNTKDDDLALPASILGEAVKTDEMEDA